MEPWTSHLERHKTALHDRGGMSAAWAGGRLASAFLAEARVRSRRCKLQIHTAACIHFPLLYTVLVIPTLCPTIGRSSPATPTGSARSSAHGVASTRRLHAAALVSPHIRHRSRRVAHVGPGQNQVPPKYSVFIVLLELSECSCLCPTI